MRAALQQIKVDVWAGDQFKPEFLKVNPNAKVPAIVDHDGPGGKPYTVFESGAILLYLAEKTGKFLPAERRARFEAIQWLMVQLTGVGPAFGQTVHFKMMAPPGNDYSLSRYTTEMKRLYELMEKRLGEVPYLGGMDYTIADIATFPWTRTPRQFRREVGRPSKSRALVQQDFRTPGGQEGAGDGRQDHLVARYRDRRSTRTACSAAASTRAHDDGKIRQAARASRACRRCPIRCRRRCRHCSRNASSGWGASSTSTIRLAHAPKLSRASMQMAMGLRYDTSVPRV